MAMLLPVSLFLTKDNLVQTRNDKATARPLEQDELLRSTRLGRLLPGLPVSYLHVIDSGAALVGAVPSRTARAGRGGAGARWRWRGLRVKDLCTDL